MYFVVGIDLGSDSVVATGDLAVFDFAVDGFDRFHDAAAGVDRDDFVSIAMEGPDGDILELVGLFGRGTTRDRHAGSKEVGLHRDEGKGAEAAHGIAREVDALRVDGEVLHEFLGNGEDAVRFLSFPAVAGGLGCDDETGAFAVVPFFRESGGVPRLVRSHDVVILAVEVDDEGVEFVTGFAEFALAEDAVLKAMAFMPFPGTAEEFDQLRVGLFVLVRDGCFGGQFFSNPFLIPFGKLVESYRENLTVGAAANRDLSVCAADIIAREGLFFVGAGPLAGLQKSAKREGEEKDEVENGFHGIREFHLARLLR